MNFVSSNIEWCEVNELQGRAASHIKEAFSVLDIGCGIRPQQFVVPQLLICVEPHQEYVEVLKKNLTDSDAFIVPLDAIQALAAFPDRSVDTIFMIDVIEHMTKEAGIEVIRECERVARMQVVLFTPLGFMPQETLAGDVDGWNLHGGEWQDHKSGWYPEDFPGWDIVACKHLHAMDVKGQKIDPPYGGFYAIRSLAKVGNYFNDEYSREVFENSTSGLNKLKAIFPKFIDHIIAREVKNSNLRCGMQASQKATELFIDFGATKSHGEIMELVSRQKAADYLVEARNFNIKIDEFAKQFFEFNNRESELLNRESSLAERELKLSTSESELANRDAEFSARNAVISAAEKNILAKEQEVRLTESEISKKEKDIEEKYSALKKSELDFAETKDTFYNTRLVKFIQKVKIILG